MPWQRQRAAVGRLKAGLAFYLPFPSVRLLRVIVARVLRVPPSVGLASPSGQGIVFGALDGGRNVDAEFVELVAQFALIGIVCQAIHLKLVANAQVNADECLCIS